MIMSVAANQFSLSLQAFHRDHVIAPMAVSMDSDSTGSD